MNSLTLAVLLAVLAVAHAKIDVEATKKLFDACKEETGAEEKFEDIMDKDLIPTSDNGMCLMRCLLIKHGVYNGEGVYSAEGSKEYLTKIFSHKPENIDKSVAISQECSKIDVEGLEKCEASVKYISCVKAKTVQQNIKWKE